MQDFGGGKNVLPKKNLVNFPIPEPELQKIYRPIEPRGKMYAYGEDPGIQKANILKEKELPQKINNSNPAKDNRGRKFKKIFRDYSPGKLNQTARAE